MITELYIANYKCFKARKDFPLSSVNLFTGLNGRGKSSVLQTVLLLSQSVINTDSLKDLLISSSWLKLGDFDDIKSSPSSDDNSITLGFKTDIEKLNSFEFKYEEKKGAIGKGILREYTLNGEKSSKDSLSTSPTTAPSEEEETNNVSVINYQDDPRILKIFRNVHYVSADREGPKLYVEKYGLSEIQKAGVHGENTIRILSSYQEPLNAELFFDEQPKDILELCQQWMSFIFDGVKMEIASNKDDSVLSLNFNPQTDSTYYKAVNVGFGYSYVLSLVISCLIAKKDEILIIENPEAHLHPRAQSRLTQLLVRLAQTGVQIFVESHSEHILNGFRLAVANKENTFTNDMLCVYYFDEKFEVIKMNVQLDGFIENWPSGFFDQNELDMSLLFRYSRKK